MDKKDIQLNLSHNHVQGRDQNKYIALWSAPK